ncbi:hypothetical protein PV326_010677 [Microctonus aethiopoides]|nr:hypothetical protein PV326_010677 [Microctonus aethiopoides]
MTSPFTITDDDDDDDDGNIGKDEELTTVNRASKLLQPIKVYPKGSSIKNDGLSKSHRLMLDMGIIRQANTGLYTLLPLGNRVLEKLISIVDYQLSNIGAQKINLPNLTNANLWAKTGRLKTMIPEIFQVKDRHGASYILGPTHEEAITDLIANIGPMQKNQLPLLLYQISNKWRDEMKPRLGLFRSREFVMKDLYSFDLADEEALKSYKSIDKTYKNILDQIGIPYIVAIGDTGLMGGTMSHEYHYLSSIGEDSVLSCNSCGIHVNAILDDKSTCRNCNQLLEKNSAIEIGHTFLLGTKYSSVLQATCHFNNNRVPLAMGCYGLGLTRIISAAVEILSTNEDLRWPKCIAPYTVCVIPPKENSKEYPATHYADKIIEMLYEKDIDFLIDDRIDLTIGRRMMDARRTGYPYIIVVGRTAMESNPLFELHDINNSQQSNISFDQLVDFFKSTNQVERIKATG